MEKSKKENISIGKISELLKNAPTHAGPFSACFFRFFFVCRNIKKVTKIKNGNGITLEELEKEREALYENYSRNFG